MQRSVRTLIAIMLFLLAGYLIVNNLVLGAQMGDWLLPLGLLVVGLIVSLYPTAAAASPTHTDAAGHLPAPEPVPTLAATAAPPPSVPAPPAVPSTAPASGKPDDLTIINGIGPKMQTALRSAGFDSFAKIAASNGDELRAVVLAAGMRLAPTIDTWPEQARQLMK